MKIIRQDYMKQLWDYADHDLIKVVTGMRRCGKSTLLSHFQNALADKEDIDIEQIQSYNFEDPNSLISEDWRIVFNNITSKMAAGSKNYIFLDEVQNLAEFEKLVDGLYVNPNIDLYITGSNANLLSGELATLLSGRYIEISILPFSFKEFCLAKNIDITNKYLDFSTIFLDFINETSLPKGIELLTSGIDSIETYTSSVFSTVIEKDIRKRNNIKDMRVFNNVLKYALANIGSELSPNNISTALKADGQNVHHTTVEKYLKYLCDAFILYEVNRFDIRGKRQLATQEKYYVVDMGIRELLLGRDFLSDRGHKLENIVYLELLRRNRKVWIGKANNQEIDFVTRENNGELNYYQVVWDIGSEETLKREVGAFSAIKDNYPKILLSANSSFDIGNGIIHQNVFHWLLGIDS